jgi:hypothetical protein
VRRVLKCIACLSSSVQFFVKLTLHQFNRSLGLSVSPTLLCTQVSFRASNQSSQTTPTIEVPALNKQHDTNTTVNSTSLLSAHVEIMRQIRHPREASSWYLGRWVCAIIPTAPSKLVTTRENTFAALLLLRCLSSPNHAAFFYRGARHLTSGTCLSMSFFCVGCLGRRRFSVEISHAHCSAEHSDKRKLFSRKLIYIYDEISLAFSINSIGLYYFGYLQLEHTVTGCEKHTSSPVLPILSVVDGRIY